MPYVLFLLCSLIWSASFILMKKAALGFSPWGVATGRCLWGIAILSLLCWRTRRFAILRRDEWIPTAMVALLGCAWPYAIQPLIVSRQGSAFMALVVSVVPLATLAVSIPMLGTWPTRLQWVGVFGALVCMGILLADRLHRQIGVTDVAIGVTVPISYALANTVIRARLREMAPPILTLYMLGLSVVVLAPMDLFFPAPTAADEVWWVAAVSLAILGILGTGLATYWFNQLVRDHGPLFAGMTTNVVPIGALLWGWVDGEQITLAQCVALVGIVAMVVLVQFRAAAKPAEVILQPSRATKGDRSR